MSFILCSCKGKKGDFPSQNTTGSEIKHFYGDRTKNRIPVQSYDNELAKSIGAILVNGKITGTGSLVGNRLVLTNEHVLSLSGTTWIRSDTVTFIPFVNMTGPSTSKRAIPIIDAKLGNYSERTKYNDWAVLLLKNHPTDERGNLLPYLPVSRRTITNGIKISLATMSNDQYISMAKLLIQPTCKIRYTYRNNRKMQGILLHDCDADKKSSGGPLLENCGNRRYCIIGIQTFAAMPGDVNRVDFNFEKYQHAVSNLAISYKNWKRAIESMKKRRK